MTSRLTSYCGPEMAGPSIARRWCGGTPYSTSKRRITAPAISATEPRHPECTAATTPSPVMRIGTQSAVHITSPTPVSAVIKASHRPTQTAFSKGRPGSAASDAMTRPWTCSPQRTARIWVPRSVINRRIRSSGNAAGLAGPMPNSIRTPSRLKSRASSLAILVRLSDRSMAQ